MRPPHNPSLSAKGALACGHETSYALAPEVIMKSTLLLVVPLLASIALGAACSPSSPPVAAATTTTTGSDAGAAYVCPMDPEVTSATPGTCPKCGMKLVPKK